MENAKLSSVMTKSVQTVNTGEPLLKALKLMADRGLSCLIVIVDSRPVGILTERDVVKLFAGDISKIAKSTVGDVMSNRVYLVPSNLTVSDTGMLMKINGCRHFPVVSHVSRLVGLVTQSDILRTSLRALEDYSRRLEKTVQTRTAELKRKNDELEKLSVTDPLTGLYNRRYLHNRIEEEFARSRRHKLTLGCTIVDIDHFKPLNDTYGHEFGDIVLHGVAQCLRKAARKGDFVGRYGGDEFVVIGQMENNGILVLAERIREAVGSRPFMAGKNQVDVTVSVGASIFDPGMGILQESDELLKAADTALYEAKAQGRNRSECHRYEMTSAA